MKIKEEETYLIKTMCSNCNYGLGFSHIIKIPKGIKKMGYIKQEVCPHCGCLTMVEK